MPGGRPLDFKTKEELQAKIDEYFEETPEKERTISGLALKLNTTTQTLWNYEKREEFFETVKKAKLRVALEYEKDLRRKGRAGDIFALKNFGWTDQRQVDHTTKGRPISILSNVHGDDSDKEALEAEEKD